MRVVVLPWLVLLALVAAGCGDDEPVSGTWQHMRLEGLAGATGLTLVDDDLVVVCGGDDRELRTLPRTALRPGGSARVRTLAVTTRPDAPVSGASPFAIQGYTLEHLWKVPVDFQAVAFQPPHFLYVGERNRRLVFWGRVRRDASGVLAAVKFDHIAVAPGADRSGVERGDWTDHGPGLRGLAAVRRSGRMEDLWVTDGGFDDGRLAVRRMDRYGSNLQGVALGVGEAKGEAHALSLAGGRLHVLRGEDSGRIVAFVPPAGTEATAVTAAAVEDAPRVPGVTHWTGMAHGDDGTLFLVSGGSPAVLAWRRP